MRVYVAGAAIVLFLFAGSTLVRAGDAPGGTKTTVAGVAAAPVIDVWYGSDQRFGATGTPQRRANILGTASHATGISKLSYQLNGGSSRTLSFIADGRRIISTGDFNIDLKFDELIPGANTVLIKAKANNGDSSQTTVTVRNQSGSQVWPIPYSYAWTQFVDSAQIVDGQWSLMGGGARIIQPGYDRLIAIGDTTWTDYEVTVKVTVHGLDSSAQAWSSNSGGPGIGILMRWKGHTNTPVFSPPIIQPLSGYTPIGAIGWFHWKKGYGFPGPNQWEIGAPSGSDLTWYAGPQAPPLYYGVQYYFKMQVKSSGSGPLYKFKVWQVGATEPVPWLMTRQEPPSAQGSGSVVLLAHHVSATFGEVKISDGIPPVISNIVPTPAATTATITWTTDEPATSVVDYGLSSSYGSTVSDLTNLVTSHTIQLQNLTPSTTYHYRVTSADGGGASSSSGDLNFTTTVLTAPLAPVLVFPGNGSSGNPPSLTFVWRKSVTATGYRLQLGTDSTFATGILVDDASLIDTTRVVSGLTAGTRYYWHVNARNGGGEGSFSSPPSMFKTALGIPVLLSPPNGALNISPTPRLTWSKVPSASTYRLQISTDPAFATGIAFDDSTTIVDTFRVASGLQVGQKYYWRVQARNSVTVGTFSPPWDFTPGLASPALISPANGATNQSVNITLQWGSVTGATWYDLQLGTNPTFASGLVVSDSFLVGTTRSVNGLAAGTVFYWRVRARNAQGVGQYSAPPWSFSTGLGIAQLVVPANGSKDQPLTIIFSWKPVASATAYAFQLATDSTFGSGIIKNDTSVVDTFRQVAGLSYKTTYYWRVRAKQGGLSGPMSPVWRVTTIPCAAVVLIELADGAQVPGDPARFIWTSSQPGVNRYWFEVAFDSLFSFTSVDSSVVDTTVVRSLASSGWFYWRVRAGNPDGWGPFSPTRHFNVITSVDGSSEQGMPTSFALDQNYPNPFNPTTWVHFALPKRSNVRLDVYSILGEWITTLVDEGMEPGFHRVEFAARDSRGRALAAGMYIYRLSTPEFTQAKKMILLK